MSDIDKLNTTSTDKLSIDLHNLINPRNNNTVIANKSLQMVLLQNIIAEF